MSFTLSLDTASIVLYSLEGELPSTIYNLGLYTNLCAYFLLTISPISKVFLKNLAGGARSTYISKILLDPMTVAYTLGLTG